jgi:alpha-D-xyloside xylohydrolase
MDAEYQGMPAHLLHNLYALLYQKAAFEITRQVKGEGLVWARAGWVGCQRYPVHWGGDSACTWDGLAGSLRGGLHLGVSGFAFWSHDTPGFHGLPNFMNSWPTDDLYVRWTQASVFVSHMRYHGAQPREPYEYPAIADLVRRWWRLRYALIPYLAESGRQAVKSGYPVLRALLFHHPEDPVCWQIDDQFYSGRSLLVAPVLNGEGKRDVYLPKGAWRDLWTGERFLGPVWLKGVVSPLERIPVYVVDGESISIYPEVVQCTDEMDLRKVTRLVFDETFRGLSESILGAVTGL